MAENRRHPLVFVCSPYRGDVESNVRQAERFCRIFFLRHNAREVKENG